MSYTPNTPSRSPLWLHEENFRLALELLPELDEGADRITITTEEGEHDLEVEVAERSRYTTTLALTKRFNGVLIPELAMKARIYYDAAVMEVLSYQDCFPIPPRYQVRPGGRFLRDEKRQINQLLNELLHHCLRNMRGVGLTRA